MVLFVGAAGFGVGDEDADCGMMGTESSAIQSIWRMFICFKLCSCSLVLEWNRIFSFNVYATYTRRDVEATNNEKDSIFCWFFIISLSQRPFYLFTTSTSTVEEPTALWNVIIIALLLLPFHLNDFSSDNVLIILLKIEWANKESLFLWSFYSLSEYTRRCVFSVG